MNPIVVKKLECNKRKATIESVYTVSLDTYVTLDNVQQRMLRILHYVGFTPEDKKGFRTPYLLTGGGTLHTQTHDGQKSTRLADGLAMVQKAYMKADSIDDKHFCNPRITRDSGVSFNPVVGSPVKLGE